MTNFKTLVVAAAAVLSVATTTSAETEMDQVRHWLNQLGPKLEPTRAGPDLTKCAGGSDLLQCRQRLLDEQLASLQNVRFFLDQNPSPKCLHDTEVRIRQVITMMEISFEFVRNNASDRSDILIGQKGAQMTDLVEQLRQDVVAQARRDVITCIFSGQRNYFQ
jgi:hypothetical protein